MRSGLVNAFGNSQFELLNCFLDVEPTTRSVQAVQGLVSLELPDVISHPRLSHLHVKLVWEAPGFECDLLCGETGVMPACPLPIASYGQVQCEGVQHCLDVTCSRLQRAE